MTKTWSCLVLLMSGCSSEPELAPVPELIRMTDTNHSGAVDCADLEHVNACTQHPDAHECADADVTHDGHIDAHDTQAIHDALAHAGHDCSSGH